MRANLRKCMMIIFNTNKESKINFKTLCPLRKIKSIQKKERLQNASMFYGGTSVKACVEIVFTFKIIKSKKSDASTQNEWYIARKCVIRATLVQRKEREWQPQPSLETLFSSQLTCHPLWLRILLAL